MPLSVGGTPPAATSGKCFLSMMAQKSSYLSKRRGGPKAVGKWFNNKKEGVKGVKWDDGTVWEKMDYKIFPAPNEFTEALGKARNEAKAAEKGK